MKALMIIAILSILSVSPALAQTEAYQQKRLADTEAKEKEIVSQMLTIDASIEKRIGQIINHLSSIKDSQDSNTRVLHNKSKAIESLRNSIKWYTSERNKAEAELKKKYPGQDTADLAKRLTTIDGRIDTRVEQITALTDSFTENKDLKRYETYRNGWYDTTYTRQSEKWKQNSKETSKGSSEMEDLLDGITNAMTDLESKIKLLETQKKYATDPEHKQRYEGLIKMNQELLEKRRAQAEELIKNKPAQTKAVSSKQLHHTEKVLRSMTHDLQKDFRQLKSLKIQLDQTRATKHRMSKQLDRAK